LEVPATRHCGVFGHPARDWCRLLAGRRSRDTNDQEFAAKRQRFLAEQGYAYEIADAETIAWT
jgi:hypothetical protein